MMQAHIQLTDSQVGQLEALARRRGISTDTLLSEAVERLLGEEVERREEHWRRFFAVAGTFRSNAGSTDVSVNHDKYLDDAYYDWNDD